MKIKRLYLFAAHADVNRQTWALFHFTKIWKEIVCIKRPLAYITAAWGADEIENTEDAARYCRKVYDANFSNAHYILELLRFIRHRN